MWGLKATSCLRILNSDRSLNLSMRNCFNLCTKPQCILYGLFIVRVPAVLTFGAASLSAACAATHSDSIIAMATLMSIVKSARESCCILLNPAELIECSIILTTSVPDSCCPGGSLNWQLDEVLESHEHALPANTHINHGRLRAHPFPKTSDLLDPWHLQTAQLPSWG